MPSGLKAVVFLLSILLLGPLLRASDQPSVHASISSPSGAEDVSILVTGADPVGLDSLTISWLEGDLSYHTELPHSAADRGYKRTFRLRELFPAADAKQPVHLTVEIRNTRGAVGSTNVSIEPRSPKLNNEVIH